MFFEISTTFDLIYFLYTLVALIVVYFAWKSTEVRALPPAAVLLIEDNQRRQLLESVIRTPTIIRANSIRLERETNSEINRQPLQRRSLNLFDSVPAPSLQDVLEEVSDLTLARATRSPSQIYSTNTEETNQTDLGPEEIIQNMDSSDRTSSTEANIHNSSSSVISNDGLRYRRPIGFVLDSEQTENINENDGTASNGRDTETESTILEENLNIELCEGAVGGVLDSTHADNCSNENNENENISKNEFTNKYSQNDFFRRPMPSAPPLWSEFNENYNLNVKSNSCSDRDDGNTSKDEMNIKLKYLNDDQRLVKGSPHEALGDFKKRHFTVELAAEKFVRLVFNGHVLQPDTKSLQSFGLFDNCVVHCLIHKKPTNPNPQNNTGGTTTQQGTNNQSNNNNNTNPQRENSSSATGFRSSLANGPLFVYATVAVTFIAIVFCWYCRIQYSYLFSLYSTIGLIFMTALLFLIFPMVILIERDVNV